VFYHQRIILLQSFLYNDLNVATLEQYISEPSCIVQDQLKFHQAKSQNNNNTNICAFHTLSIGPPAEDQ
jgi:hypothetical protein